MDWYSWLSNSGLKPSLVEEYALLFSQNELEEDDTVHFNHEFLQSMGISIAKHRLEILKLAKRKSPQPAAQILAVVSKTRKCLARCIHMLVVRHDSSEIMVMPKPSYGGGGRWWGTILNRNKRLVLLQQGRLMITKGGFRLAQKDSNSLSHSASPMVYKCGENGKGGDGFWGSDDKEIRWDSNVSGLEAHLS